MRKYAVMLMCVFASGVALFEPRPASGKDASSSSVTRVATFKGQQVTGVAVNGSGRIFVNFPRWRKGVESSVVEIDRKGPPKPYPDRSWNSWEIGEPVSETKFVGVQSVVAYGDTLYVLDTRSSGPRKILDDPRVFVFNLKTDKLAAVYKLSKGSYHDDSYINDLRLDAERSVIYFTDSGHAGLTVYDIRKGSSFRALDNHYSTKAEVDHLTFGGVSKPSRASTDGIAYDSKSGRLFYHALSGYSLYSISAKTLISGDSAAMEKAVTFECKTSAPDGMIFDAKGNLYFGDLENNRIMYRSPDGKIRTFIEGEAVRWADSFAVHGGWLYYTNSRINEVKGDVSEMEFTLNKVPLAK
jgi:sugar lactone lactonase YvrE